MSTPHAPRDALLQVYWHRRCRNWRARWSTDQHGGVQIPTPSFRGPMMKSSFAPQWTRSESSVDASQTPPRETGACADALAHERIEAK